ncbi:helix-turn-helix domain-containing protein [Arthrobacter globiformis]|uniref:helix-turn-helix domain-containing protein n=1 Tax=Arthrobacter globiformis TaxID=1665 RepID=UPI000B419892|nr:helix-turn-helix domain-containing protein [Arthrobacter globiformis]
MTSKAAGGQPDMKVREVAALLNIDPETVRTLARQGVFPNAYKTGLGAVNSPVRIPWVDVENYRRKQPRVYG